MPDISLKELEAATGGTYRIHSLIGEGGMGAVFLGEHTALGSKVAIKVLPPQVRSDAVRLERFRREASLAAQLSHPNLVQAFEFQLREDLAYLVMPFIEGLSLDRVLAEAGPLSLDDVLDLTRQVGKALGFAHARGVVHRDVKPGNIMQEGATGRWLVTDFGVAHVGAEEATQLTESDATIGTLAYMAPEQLGGAKHVDARADIYSLAIVAFESLTGQLPERDGADRAASQLRSLRPDIPEPLCRALTLPLAGARDQRPSSTDEWLATLVSTRRSWRLVAGIGAAVLTVAVTLSVLLTRTGSAPPGPQTPLVAVLPVEIEGRSAQLDLERVLPSALTLQIQSFPGLRTVDEALVRSLLERRPLPAGATADDRLALAQSLNVTQALMWSVRVHGDSLDVRTELYDVARARFMGAGSATGPIDSVHNLVSQVVLETVGRQIARELTGTDAPALPAGTPAVGAYFDGIRAFRRGRFEDAEELFVRVADIDPSYAPARFRQMLATIFQLRPTAVSTAARSALSYAETFQDGLDPMSRRLLGAYSLLLRQGTFAAVRDTVRAITDDYPNALDAWFLRGALEAWFPFEMESSLNAARNSLLQVVRADPEFAAAHALLFQIAVQTGDGGGRERHRDAFLSVDSTSVRAETITLADSLISNPVQVRGLIDSFRDRPAEVLENLAVSAGDLDPPGGTRPIAEAALEALWERPATPEQAKQIFRMRVASMYGSGRSDQIAALIQEGLTRGVPESEIDRWIVVSNLLPIPSIHPERAPAAAARLLTTTDEPAASRWLSAWWWAESAPDSAEMASEALRALASDTVSGLFATSLLADLDADAAMRNREIDEVLGHWERALRQYHVERVLFGFAESLWPVRWKRIGLLDSLGRHDRILELTERLDVRPGFLDQTTWGITLDQRARSALHLGRTQVAVTARERLARSFLRASGQPDLQLLAALDSLVTLTVPR